MTTTPQLTVMPQPEPEKSLLEQTREKVKFYREQRDEHQAAAHQFAGAYEAANAILLEMEKHSGTEQKPG